MNPKRITASSSPRHPIQVVARRTGLSTELIRAWERRYGAVNPARDGRNRRLYSEQEIDRLRLLRRAVGAGHRIGDLAALPRDSIAALLEAHPPAQEAEPADARLGAAMAAVSRFDGPGLRGVLDDAARSLGVPAVLDTLVTPLMTGIGERWERGALRVSHEHVATETVRDYLVTLLRSAVMGDDGPGMVVGTPAGQLHDLGALVVAIHAAVHGWQVTFLGRSNPAAEIAFAASNVGAAAVVLSQARLVDADALGAEISALRRMLHPHMPILVGGAGAMIQKMTLINAGARVLDDIPSFRVELDRIRNRLAACDPGTGGSG